MDLRSVTWTYSALFSYPIHSYDLMFCPQLVIMSNLVRNVFLHRPVWFSVFQWIFFIGELFWYLVIEHPYCKPSHLKNTLILPLIKSPELPLFNDSYSPLTSSFLEPNILDRDQLPQTLTILSFTKVRSYNLKLYKTRSVVLCLCVLNIHIFSNKRKEKTLRSDCQQSFN